MPGKTGSAEMGPGGLMGLIVSDYRADGVNGFYVEAMPNQPIMPIQPTQTLFCVWAFAWVLWIAGLQERH